MVGYTQGRLIIVNFDLHLPFDGIDSLFPGEIEKDRAKYIAKDRANADKVMNDIYSQLSSNKINFDQAMEMERSDPLVGTKALPTTPHSGSFNTADTESPLYNILTNADYIKLIQDTKAGSYSKPTVLKAPLGSKADAPTAEARYVVVQVDKRVGQLANSLSDFVTSQKNQLKYKKL